MSHSSNEIWKKVKFDFEFTNKFKLEVSNHGKIRSTNMLATERHLKGSFINNYRVIVLKLYKPRSAKMEQRLKFLKGNLSNIMQSLSPLNQKIKLKVKHDKKYFANRKKAKELKELHNGLKDIYRKEYNDDLKLRTITHTLLVHRLVAESFCDKTSTKHDQVIHLDYNKKNNRAHNLKWVTQEEVNAHQLKSPRVKAAIANRKGKRYEGAKNYKLNSTKVMLIKKRLNAGKSLADLSKMFKVTPMQISRIKNGQSWGDIRAAI